MSRTPHLTVERFVAIVGETEVLQVAGIGSPGSPARAVDDEKVGRAVAYADRLVEGYVRGRYPAGATHPLLEVAAADIARYRLRSDANPGTVGDEVRHRHDMAMRTLKDVQAGRTALTDDDGAMLGEAEGPAGAVHTTTTVDARMPEGRAVAALEGWLR